MACTAVCSEHTYGVGAIGHFHKELDFILAQCDLIGQ